MACETRIRRKAFSRKCGYSYSTVVKNHPAGVHIMGKVRKDAVLYAPVVPHNGSARRGRPRKKGIELPKGTLVSTGMITGVHDVRIGSNARVDFGAPGWFDVSFEPIYPQLP